MPDDQQGKRGSETEKRGMGLLTYSVVSFIETRVDLSMSDTDFLSFRYGAEIAPHHRHDHRVTYTGH